MAAVVVVVMVEAGAWLGVTVEVIISDAIASTFSWLGAEVQGSPAGDEDAGGEGMCDVEESDGLLLCEESIGRRWTVAGSSVAAVAFTLVS